MRPERLRFMCGNIGRDPYTHHGPCLFIDATQFGDTEALADGFNREFGRLQPLPGVPNLFDGRSLSLLLHRFGPGPDHWMMYLGTAHHGPQSHGHPALVDPVYYVAQNGCTCDQCIWDFVQQTASHGGFAFTVQSLSVPELAAPFKIGIPARNVQLWDTTGPQILPQPLQGVYAGE